MRVAKAWGVKPWELHLWFDMPRDQRALILAYEIEEAKAAYWASEWSRKDA